MSDERADRPVSELTNTLFAAASNDASTAVADESADDPQALPGVGGEAMSLRDGLARGGAFTFIILLVLNSLDELEAGALALLAPNIRDSFGISDGAITFIGSAAGAFVVLGAFPMGYLADRYRRAPIVGISSLAFTGFVFLTGLAVNAFTIFCTRLGAGIAKANTLPVHSSLIADTYPIQVRGRMGAINAMAGRSVGAIAPVIIGLIVLIAGGDDGWRWAFILLGLPVAVVAVLAFRIPEPVRGQWEKSDVLDTVIESDEPGAISVEAAFARLRQIRTLRSVVVAFCAIGFLIFTLGVQTNIYLDDEFGLDTLERGIVASIAGVAAALFLPFVGRRFDRLYRNDPESALRLLGYYLLPLTALIPVQFLVPNPVAFVVLSIPIQVLFTASFAMVAPTVQAIVPYQLRGLGNALVTLYIFLVGAVGGSILAAFLIDAYGPRIAIITLAIPSIGLGAVMLLRGASSIREDLALIAEELHEELAEHERRRDVDAATPAIQLANVDVSYGRLQVLFGVDLEVASGETLALLGTNGAGKTTALKAISGLIVPDRGVVRHHGRTITFHSPEWRVAHGIQMLPGGRGVWPHLTVRDNLVVGAYAYRRNAEDCQRRIDGALARFPVLGGRLDDTAAQLSGGQQQALALARVMLHEPDVLLIDELSLGLAPAVVEELLVSLEDLKRQGQTMIIVEQSLNVALSIADRAVFMEKGTVRFDGPAAELVERDDLVRAVFLGTGD